MAPPQFQLTTFLEQRVQILDQVHSPEWHKIKAHKWDCYARDVTSFAELASNSLDLMESLTQKVPQKLLKLESRTVQQYLQHIVQGFYSSFEQHINYCWKAGKKWHKPDEEKKKLKEAIARLTYKLDRLGLYTERTQASPGLVWRNWIAISIFTPVYAALAARQTPGKNFYECLSDNTILQWNYHSRLYRPNTVVFDLSHSLIGETRCRWPKCKDNDVLDVWEQELHDQRFSLHIRSIYTASRKTIK
jgi:hypothetical protein